MRVREGTVTVTGSHPHSRWSLGAQGHSILSSYQASYPRWHSVSSGSAFEREHMLNGKESA